MAMLESAATADGPAAQELHVIRSQIRDDLAAKDENTRAALAGRLSAHLSATGAETSERKAAEELARQLAHDAVEIVRLQLAEAVKNYSFLPRDIALKIAHDVDSVACPFLQATEVFSAEDWQQLILTVTCNARVAIANRETVSEHMSESLAQIGEAEVADALVANAGAQIQGSSLTTLMERFSDRTTLMEQMAGRRELPADIVIALVSKVSEAARKKLAEAYDMEDFTNPVAAEAHVNSLLQILDGTDPEEFRNYAENLNRRGELSPGFLLRALDEGHAAFVEAAFAVQTKITVDDARKLIRFGGETAITKLCDKAGIAPPLQADFLARFAKAQAKNVA